MASSNKWTRVSCVSMAACLCQVFLIKNECNDCRENPLRQAQQQLTIYVQLPRTEQTKMWINFVFRFGLVFLHRISRIWNLLARVCDEVRAETRRTQIIKINSLHLHIYFQCMLRVSNPFIDLRSVENETRRQTDTATHCIYFITFLFSTQCASGSAAWQMTKDKHDLCLAELLSTADLSATARAAGTKCQSTKAY